MQDLAICWNSDEIIVGVLILEDVAVVVFVVAVVLWAVDRCVGAEYVVLSINFDSTGRELDDVDVDICSVGRVPSLTILLSSIDVISDFLPVSVTSLAILLD